MWPERQEACAPRTGPGCGGDEAAFISTWHFTGALSASTMLFLSSDGPLSVPGTTPTIAISGKRPQATPPPCGATKYSEFR